MVVNIGWCYGCDPLLGSHPCIATSYCSMHPTVDPTVDSTVDPTVVTVYSVVTTMMNSEPTAGVAIMSTGMTTTVKTVSIHPNIVVVVYRKAYSLMSSDSRSHVSSISESSVEI